MGGANDTSQVKSTLALAGNMSESEAIPRPTGEGGGGGQTGSRRTVLPPDLIRG